ncbi:hypothetical protein COT97_01600 [Candidatus Falkowbacteria bacterium CG10_big_fil_rev_8_21_14_0_10_39_11]|uniref:Uncharacterized protein n=1 Tax=Candidatus Falkowbacteria bacterium CG10_big_fil_rev_8_21_14_0_10_39_11 TaxID=1974565 RepID=A0A2H0V5L9_9BACT|nr:MAG: hypothetical protein COT97_01600 [Candidatus Falkowbacteria bacterium CG10_big_fil_rev_8_21_14_0_10_39_11]
MPENNLLSIKDLTIKNPKKKSDYFCQNFKIFPENKEKHGGFLFGIIELRATNIAQSEKIYTTILNTLKESYYQQILNSPDPTKCNLETIFEFALNKTNQKIIELIQIGQINLIIENLNYFIGIIKPNDDNTNSQLYFTCKGQIHVYVIHKTKKNDFKLISIIDKDTQNNPTNSNDKIKIFSVITSGQLFLHDTIIIMTEIFHNLISPAKILYILSNNSINEAIDYFKVQIRQLKNKNYQDHCTLFLKHEPAINHSQKSDSEKSIANLINTTETTEKLLTPSFAINITKHFKKALTLISKVFSIDPTKPQHGPKYSFSQIITRIRFSLEQLFHRPETKSSTPTEKVSNHISFSPKRIFQSLASKKTTTIIITSIIVFSLLLTGGIMWSKNQTKKNESNVAYENQINSVKDLIADAESSYIYKDQNKSLEYLKNAITELSYLPQATENQQINHQELQSQIKDLKHKLFNIEKISLEQIVTLEINGQQINANQILIINNKIYALGNSKTIAVIDPTNKSLESIINYDTDITMGTSDENGNIRLVSKDNSLLSLQNSNFTKIKTLDSQPNNIQIYNGRLYTLLDGQITKSNDNGAGSESNWLTTTEDLSQASDLTIDGSIYVLTKDGKLLKYYAGDAEAINSPIFDPETNNAEEIFTTPELNNLYISDPANKRIIVVDKQGSTVKQLQFDNLNQIQAITISTDGQIGYVIADHNLYKFSL